MNNLRQVALLVFLVVLTGVVSVSSEEQGKQSGDDLAAKIQNPVGAMYSLPFKFTFDYGADDGDAQYINIQPVVPISIGEWNIVNRLIEPIGGGIGRVFKIGNQPIYARLEAC